MSGCRFCLIKVLAGFHFLLPRLYANIILAHDLVETVLIGCKFCSIEVMQVFTSWFIGLKVFHCIFIIASLNTQFTVNRSHF